MAIALRVERRLVEFVARPRQPQFAVRGKHRAALRELRGDDAVKHVHPAMHRLQNIDRRAHPHQVARQRLRQKIRHEARELIALRVRLAHRQPADGQPVKRQLRQIRRALFAQVVVTRALHDPEHRLRPVAPRRQRAHRPPVRQVHRRLRLLVGRRRGDALVEHHVDIAPDRPLHRHARLRREHVVRAVDIALKPRAFLVHRALARQRENLKPARVRQHRPVPIHEAVNPAEFLKHLRTRPQQQMIGIRQQHPRARRLERLDGLPFHRRLCAHRHEDRRLHLAVQRRKRARARLRARRRPLQSEIQS